jgi:hypothetical protein
MWKSFVELLSGCYGLHCFERTEEKSEETNKSARKLQKAGTGRIQKHELI